MTWSTVRALCATGRASKGGDSNRLATMGRRRGEGGQSSGRFLPHLSQARGQPNADLPKGWLSAVSRYLDDPD